MRRKAYDPSKQYLVACHPHGFIIEKIVRTSCCVVLLISNGWAMYHMRRLQVGVKLRGFWVRSLTALCLSPLSASRISSPRLFWLGWATERLKSIINKTLMYNPMRRAQEFLGRFQKGLPGS